MQGGQRHAVNVSAGGRVGRIDVGVSVDPDQADVLILSAIKFGDSGNGAGGHGVISAKRQRNFSCFERFDDELCVLSAGGGNFF